VNFPKINASDLFKSPPLVPTAFPSSAPTRRLYQTPKGVDLIDCVGPDGRHFSTTQNKCNEFNKSWNVHTPVPTRDPNKITRCMISSNCGGGYKETTINNCESMTCCQIENEWKLLDGGECKRQQCERIVGYKEDS
jgi:hypothetical protein